MIGIELADGTLIENLSLNGDNYISQTPIEDSVFEDNLETVIVYDGDEETVYKNMKLIQNKQYGDEYWFILSEKSKEELEREALQKETQAIKVASSIETMELLAMITDLQGGVK